MRDPHVIDTEQGRRHTSARRWPSSPMVISPTKPTAPACTTGCPAPMEVENGPPRYSKGGRRRQWRSQRRCARYAGQLRLGRGAKSGAGASPSSCGGRAREKTAGRKTEGEVHGAERSGELGHNSGERFPGRGSFSLLTEASTRCAKMSRRCGRDGGLNGKLGRPGELAPARRGARWL